MEQKVSESGRCDGVTAKIGDGEPQADGIPVPQLPPPATQQKGGAVIRTAALMKELSH
jgi:hypothetical protein